MANPIELEIGGRNVAYQPSDTFIAVDPRPMSRLALESFRSGAGDRRHVHGTLAGYEIRTIELGAVDNFRSFSRSQVPTQRVYHTSGDGVPFVPTGRITIGLSGKAPKSTDKLLDEANLTFERTVTPNRFVVRTAADPVMTSAWLLEKDGIVLAEPDLATYWEPFCPIPIMDAQLKDQWHLQNTGWHRGTDHKFKKGADARVIAAWEELGSLGSADVFMGIVDDGFDLTHLDLSNKALDAWDVDSNSDNVLPRHRGNGVGDWHGTGCAGLLAGRAAGGEIVGVAPMSKLIPVRIGPEFDEHKLERIFNYMRAKNAWLVNCSWGPTAQDYPIGTNLQEAISRCVSEGRHGLGAPILFAAGNKNQPVNDDGFHNGLAAHPDVICVAASTSTDQIAAFSNHGPEIAVCAPSGGSGWSLSTADAVGEFTGPDGGTFPRGWSPGAYWNGFSGTSGACAVASGVCALILSAVPELTSDQLRLVLARSCRKIGGAGAYDENGHSTRFGHGCVDAAAAIAEAKKLLAVA
ncbi:S8 family serine peptidase [Sedimentitalea sp.]|uniref:S8 family serine peptidase n=1 Tax=Sedimentitalea sp. TaxID=2048915 RepID=UPI003296F1AB